jgi:hypothetical protein
VQAAELPDSARPGLDRASCPSMEIAFSVDGRLLTFRRSAMTGRAELQVGDDITRLQSPLRLTTHFDFRTRVVWCTRVGDHDVEVVKTRPLIFGGARNNSFTVSVDGVVVAKTMGK